MITDADRAAIAASVADLDVESWRPLDTTERDLLRRALAPAPTTTGDQPVTAA